MLHYHGTPITPRAQLERMAGRMFCVSFAAPRDLATCLRIGQSVMLDNGAFSVKTRGIAFDMPGFYDWIEPHLWHPHWAVVPDEIGGDVEQQRAMVATWPHRKEHGAPVWHLGLPLEYLDARNQRHRPAPAAVLCVEDAPDRRPCWAKRSARPHASCAWLGCLTWELSWRRQRPYKTDRSATVPMGAVGSQLERRVRPAARNR